MCSQSLSIHESAERAASREDGAVSVHGLSARSSDSEEGESSADRSHGLSGAAGRVVGDDDCLVPECRVRVPARCIVASAACFRESSAAVDEGSDCSGIACGTESDAAHIGETRSTAEFSADIERDHSHSEPVNEFVVMHAA